MKVHLVALFGAMCALALMSSAQSSRAALDLDTADIEQLTGLEGTANTQAGVFKVGFPRKDISAIVAGVRMTPEMVAHPLKPSIQLRTGAPS